MASAIIEIRVKLKNPKAIRALRKARDAADEIADSQPWNDQAKTLARAVRRAIEHLEIEAK